MSRRLRSCAASLLVLATTPAVQAQVSAITLTEPGPTFESAPYTLGFAFRVEADVHLVSLGVYDHLADGLEAAAEVGLWEGDSTAARLQTVVPAGTEAALDGLFRFAPVTALRLQPGRVYVVAAYLDAGVASSFGIADTGAASIDPRVTVLGDRFGDGFFSLSHPGMSDGTPGGWLGANFQLAPVPEPGPAALLALGLAVLGWRQRHSVFSRRSTARA
ncbi:PEP-CTERM sorting domain-containing protein [Pseudaquabacterium pictum]|uniref:Ice-binding protein C-terminal domain-containing protein n=1 Tax=Pseudaquabacterium pictum TaxID=2315236 RepID=A0A480AID0_9BURK|nr:PEP-CTERM sorting domain-containing protein [Rubrivivax pictus]GCL61183.1 hypothetical protein AQPW35_02640 [Rubrivivax pictus]